MRIPSAVIGLLASFPIVWSFLLAVPTSMAVQVISTHSDRAFAVTVATVALIEGLHLAFRITLPKSPATLAAPSRTFSRLKRLAELMVVASGACVGAAAMDFLYSSGGHWDSPFLLTFFATVAFNRVTLAVMSAVARRACAIGFFRSFQLSDEDDMDIRRMLAGYGQVQCLDRTLFWGDNWSFLGYETNTVLAPQDVVNAPDPQWRSAAATILTTSDIIVVDVSTVSPHLAWEIEQARESLPASRILFVVGKDPAPHDQATVSWASLVSEDVSRGDEAPGSVFRPLLRQGGNVQFRLHLFLWMLGGRW
jgi:hypothetical protein